MIIHEIPIQGLVRWTYRAQAVGPWRSPCAVTLSRPVDALILSLIARKSNIFYLMLEETGAKTIDGWWSFHITLQQAFPDRIWGEIAEPARKWSFITSFTEACLPYTIWIGKYARICLDKPISCRRHVVNIITISKLLHIAFEMNFRNLKRQCAGLFLWILLATHTD